jgi:hypothetical protein
MNKKVALVIGGVIIISFFSIIFYLNRNSNNEIDWENNLAPESTIFKKD